MKKREVALTLLTVFAGSFCGTVAIGWIQLAQTAEAQKTNGVNAEEFLLLDESGKARAGLGLDHQGEVGLVLTSRDGNRTLALSPDGPIAIKLTDRSGRVLWSTPSVP